MTPRTARLLRMFRNILLTLLVLLLGVFAAAYATMRLSLPILDGDRPLAKLASAVLITRDERGTAVIEAKSLTDAMRALGYVHAQERFFEMDLARRSAAGELSALLGPATLAMDQDKRRHRLRTRMSAMWQMLPANERVWVTNYCEGVNAGLDALAARPWQYFVLRTSPEPWQEVDSLLVVAEMYFMLQARGFEERFQEIQLRKQVGDKLFDWLKPSGGAWDATLDGGAIVSPLVPTAAELDTRKTPPAAARVSAGEFASDLLPGSNNWAIGGALTQHGGAMLANDMHLGFGVPNIWFRTELKIGDGAGAMRIAGVTLPGLPAIVVGSNGHIAWGFTNSYGQWFDWVALAKDDVSEKAARVTHRETIKVKGAMSVELDVRETAWGPILQSDDAADYALSWVLYRDGAVNSHPANMMFARNVDQAIAIAQRSGIPHQNVVIADQQGNIAWTIMGRIPVSESVPREAPRGRVTEVSALRTQWLAPDRYPLIRNPAAHRLWTANNRQLSGAGQAVIGDGGFDLGARGMQIRDRLREKNVFVETDLYAIQLDAEARFLRRWAVLAKQVASREKKPLAADVVGILSRWNGRADIDQVGYRVARAFRLRVIDELWKSWMAAAAPGYAGKMNAGARSEYAAWQAIEAEAANLLPQPFVTWDEFLAAQIIAVANELVTANGSLQNATWGQRNMAAIQHPFSRALPWVGRFLNMPIASLAGDNHMPRVATPSFGASERLVVSPGHEEQGILTMPGGQSGHPLSPFYGAGHREWLEGAATPLLAGAAQHRMQLTP